MGIAFAPTVTPGTYFDPPSPQDPSTPAESLLFPDPDEREESPAPSRRGGHGKKKPEDHIPRPPNAFILFRSAFIKNQHVSSDVETNHSTLSKIIGLTWQGLSRDEKAVWHNKAKLALQEHKRKFPGYTFRPLHTKGKSAEKRKVREVGPKDQKRCQKIADLLNDGLKGAELEAAIAEFDRHHVPEIITRFEAPITARSFRRSSSAPLPEGLLLSAKASGKQKARAMSSQPEISAKGKSRQTPAKKTQRDLQPDFDASESEESYCATPSSPYPTTPFPDTNPSFVSIPVLMLMIRDSPRTSAGLFVVLFRHADRLTYADAALRSAHCHCHPPPAPDHVRRPVHVLARAVPAHLHTRARRLQPAAGLLPPAAARVLRPVGVAALERATHAERRCAEHVLLCVGLRALARLLRAAAL